MGNSSSSTTRAAAITAAAAAVAATATAAWVFHSCFSSETVEPQNRSSATKESQNKSPKTEELQSRSLETTEDLDFPIYYPETKASLSGETFVYYQANEVHVDQRIIHHTRHTQLDHVQESKDTIKIMSYNIWSIKSYKRERRMNAVSHLIEQHSPDIILLQEVTPEVYIYFQSCNWWNVYKCSIKDKQATKQVKATKQVFCMMLSKLPVKKFVNKQFVNTKTCKGVSLARFTSNPKKALTVATCHLKSMNGVCTNTVQRTSQAKEAIDLLKFSPNVVLGGDMNWDESTDGPFPLTSGWCDAWSDLKPEEDGYTYDTQSNAMLRGRRFVRKRLDRFVCRLKDFDMIDIEIFGTEAIKGVSCKRSGEKLPLLPSDHYGLILTICAK